MSSLPYHEPDRLAILTQSSFLLLLNVIESVLNRVLYCGLLGQVLLGIAFGAPGGNLLSHEAQQIIVQLGYLGLILLVYEGGLSVPLVSLKANIGLSGAVAITGISIPIALSFVLQPLINATPLQAFAAGAALCSTSLGTTFTVLSTSGLTNTRLGSVLSTAAMMDDVVGLVMVQVIATLGANSTSLNALVIVRPVLVSLAFAILVPVCLRYLIRPLRDYVRGLKSLKPRFDALIANARVRCIMHSLLLFGLVAAAAWSGTSVLFTAYLAGAIINWWDAQDNALSPVLENSSAVPLEVHDDRNTDVTNDQEAISAIPRLTRDTTANRADQKDLSGASIYRVYFEQPVNRVLRPLFFVSWTKM
jgi:Kef-type K+ transport system membrane component KefB